MDKLIVKALSLKATLASDKKGVTALEYGIIASILGLFLVTIFKNFGSTLQLLFTTIGSSV